MFRTIFFLAILMALACGGQDSGSTAGSAAPDGGTTKADTGPGAAKSAAKLAADEAAKTAAKTAQAEARRAAAAALDPEVTSCLGLIREANYPEALTVCTEAARIDPDNRDVRAALEIAGAGGMEGLSNVAADAADKQARSALGDAAGKLRP